MRNKINANKETEEKRSMEKCQKRGQTNIQLRIFYPVLVVYAPTEILLILTIYLVAFSFPFWPATGVGTSDPFRNVKRGFGL